MSANTSSMEKRSYKQNCSLALAADVIGERWTMLLIRDLLIGPRRYKDLLASLKGIGTNLLAARLRDLEAVEIIARVALGVGSGVEKGPASGLGHAYALTERGRALEPTVLALIRWGLVHGPEYQDTFHHRDEWDLVALKALFQPDRAKNLAVTVQFKTSEYAGWIAIQDETASIGDGERVSADVVVNATIKYLFTSAAEPGSLLTSGTAENLRRFMSVFALRA